MEQGAGELANRIIMLMTRFVAAPALFLAGAFTVSAAGEPAIIKGADEFEFVYRVKLPEITGAARVWIPLAKTDSFQNVTVEELNIPTKWDKVQDRNYGNDICVLSAQPSDSGKTDRKSTRLNSSHGSISYAVFCLKKKTNKTTNRQ